MLHKKKVNRGFTLVELLAVIVILAIILVIAVPKIMSVITDSKKSSLETSAKMIASTAEKIKVQNIVLGKEDEEIKCKDIAKLNSNDYDLDNCTITFDTNNNASVTIKGKGKFDGLSVCYATKDTATATSEKICPTNPKYFSYEIVEDLDEDILTYSMEVVDVEKCITYANNSLYNSSESEEICIEKNEEALSNFLSKNERVISGTESIKTGIKVVHKNIIDLQVNVEKCTAYLDAKYGSNEQNSYICDSTEYLKIVLKYGEIRVEDYKDAGLTILMEDCPLVAKIIGYNTEGGLDIIIPSEINGYTVKIIGEWAFYKNYAPLGIESVVVPSSVAIIGEAAFVQNPLKKVYLENPNIRIGSCAFTYISDIEEHNLPDTYECTPR